MSSVDIYSILSSKPHNPHYLKRYINFLYTLKDQKFTNCETEVHHICPKALDLFPEYSSLKSNPWNGIKLTLRQHGLAHYILHKVYGGSQTTSFFLMGQKNSKGLRIFSSRTFEISRSYYLNQRKNVIPWNKGIKMGPSKKANKPLSEQHKINLRGPRGKLKTPRGPMSENHKELRKGPQNNPNPNRSNPRGISGKIGKIYGKQKSPSGPFFTILSNRITYSKKTLSRYYPEFKIYY